MTLNQVIAPSHELLLEAILLDGEEAILAWQRWRDAIGWQRIDYPSQRLIPMLYAKLVSLGVEHPDMLRYKGVYRHTWSTNHALLHAVLPLLRELTSNGIKTILLKSFALVVHYHEDYGLRPMSDFDLLIPTSERSKAATILTSAGWRGDVVGRHAQNFVKNRLACDLHWHLLPECCAPNDDDDLWQAAKSVTIRDLQVAVLDPADMLLHLCVHGSWWTPTASIQWIVDAMTVLTSGREVDWARLLEQTRKRGLVLPMRQALNLLADRFRAQIPAPVLDALEHAPVKLRERLDFHAQTCPVDRRSPVTALWVCARVYQQMAQSENARPNPIAFLRFLRARWKVAPRELPARMLRQVWQRL